MPWTANAVAGSSRPIPRTNKIIPMAPPVGINQVDPLVSFPPNDAVFMYNWIASNYGTRIRTGYKQWKTVVGTGGVKTIIPYIGSVSSKDRLFAAATDGIYDVSSSGTAPAAAISFSATSNSGQGIWTANTTIGGFFSCYCDEEHGYYLYTESTDSWAKVPNTDVTNVDPANLVFVMIYKSRLWFIERNTSDAWFLPVGANIGAATKFAFGNKFKHGGTLQALYTWTLDSGVAINDYLVAISSSGEVIVYTGNDPTDATNFTQVGSWFIGNVPVGRRIAGAFGGDLYILSVYGLLPMSKLVSGSLTQVQQIELTRKISPAIQAAMSATINTVGWEVKLIPSENALMIVSPAQTGYPNAQFVQALNNQGWSIYQSIPVFSGEVWHGTFYFGALDGNVYSHTGNGDNVSLDGSTYSDITASMLSFFSDVGEPGVYHRAHFVRPVFLSIAAPAYDVEVRYDYNIAQVFNPGSPSPTSGALWDVAVWDVDAWAGAESVFDQIDGVDGLGRAMAVGLQISSNLPVTLVRFDAIYDSGGIV